MIGNLVRHDVQIIARRMYDRICVQLYLVQRHENNDLTVYQIEHPDTGPLIKGTRIKMPETMGIVMDSIEGFKPFLTVPEDFFRELLSAMQRLADEEGVPRPSDDHLKGKLEATEGHLFDLQHILQWITKQVDVQNRKKGGTSHGSYRELQGERHPLNGSAQSGQ